MRKHLILIPTLEERKPLLERVCTELQRQIDEIVATDVIDIAVNPDNRESNTGKKRNELLKVAIDGGYHSVSFFDDDDLPGQTYARRIIDFMISDADCASLKGQIYFSGKPGKPFLHSIRYKEWYEDDQFYYRCPNHLNFMKLDAIKDIKFPEQTFGEDGVFSMAARDAGVFKTEFTIDEVIYHYFVGEPKHQAVFNL